jgi:acetyl esterase/lipase
MAGHLVLPLWPDGAPGSEQWIQQEQETRSQPHGHIFIRNITRPTLTVFLPDPAAATGAGAIICPGGGFHFVTFDNEGTKVAEWLNARGIAGFVLKYRLMETPSSDEEYEAQGQARSKEPPEEHERVMAEVTRRIAPLATADARQALRLVKQHAAEWRIDPGKVGMVGFSAGGRVAVGTALDYDPATRPAFVAAIYGALFEDLSAPADAPPVFIAVAADDEVAAEPCLRLYKAWRAAGRPAELHIYAQGGHGFGMLKQGLPSDGWIDRLGDWLASPGILQR